ncbi:hypothetical protein BDZ89DRAFT_1082465 [Hymenopellis radicata]|nr:hypothetical protein BDZ89DRAFT_1082465 [Hymenopellis radicata]
MGVTVNFSPVTPSLASKGLNRAGLCPKRASKGLSFAGILVVFEVKKGQKSLEV